MYRHYTLHLQCIFLSKGTNKIHSTEKGTLGRPTGIQAVCKMHHPKGDSKTERTRKHNKKPTIPLTKPAKAHLRPSSTYPYVHDHKLQRQNISAFEHKTPCITSVYCDIRYDMVKTPTHPEN